MTKKFKAWAFTIRPITRDQTRLFIDYIKKFDGGFCKLEKVDTDGQHIHCGIYRDEVSRSNLNNEIMRIWKKGNLEGEDFVQRKGTKIMYNIDFYKNYCDKEGEMLYENIPENHEIYYPSKEEQEMAAKQSVDSVMVWYEERWKCYNKVVCYNNVKEFLNEIWFIRKSKKAPTKDADKRQLCRNLCNWLGNGNVCDW